MMKFIYDWNDVPVVIDIPYASVILGVNPETVARKLRNGTLKGTKVGTSWRLTKYDLMCYLGLNPKDDEK